MTATAETYDLTIDGSGAGTPQAPGAPAVAPAGAALRKTNSRLSVVTTERRYVPKASGKPDPVAHLMRHPDVSGGQPLGPASSSAGHAVRAPPGEPDAEHPPHRGAGPAVTPR